MQIQNHKYFGQIHIGGRKPSRHDERTLQLRAYLNGAVAPPPPVIPAEVSWVTKVPRPWNMYLNDQLGCCVESAMAHMIKQMTFFAGKPVIPTDQDVLIAYEKIGGYVPGDPSTDQGSDMLTSLKYWRNTGLAGHKIVAFAAVNMLNLDEVRTAVSLFGNVFLGISLPVTVQDSNSWTVPAGGAFNDGAPGSWGGHAVPIVAMSPKTMTVVTWGQTLKMSHNFFLDYSAAPASQGEAYVVITNDWIEANGNSPSGLNVQQLLEDVALVTA